MGKEPAKGKLNKDQLKQAMERESDLFEEYYLWIEEHMPPAFFEEIERTQMMIIAHNLMGFPVQNFYSQIHFGNCSFVLCLDSPDADERILQHYSLYGIKSYRTFVSDIPPPFPDVKKKLRIATIFFTEIEDMEESVLEEGRAKEVFELVKTRNPELTRKEFDDLIHGMDQKFLRSLNEERLVLALHMFFRAKTRDHCQYEMRYNEDWDKGERENPSVQVVFAWRNAPKYRFLYRLSKMIYRHGLALKRVNSVYTNPYGKNPILVMSLGLHGIHGKPAWEEADIDDFLKELVTLKYFEDQDRIEKVFVDTDLVRGNIGNFIRNMTHFVHQALVHADPNLYSIGNIEEAICRHPELTVQLCQAFELKFHPDDHDTPKYKETRKELLNLVSALDTGNEMNDTRRKNVLIQAMNFIDFTLKTNFYRNNKSAVSYRLDPGYLDYLPFNRKDKFPALPYAIFFIQGMHFIGFHIRFQDLSRGGLRTVLPQRIEQMIAERNNVFSECYNLAYTQEKKNKDIPEGGSKAVIFLEPYERVHFEADIYRKELSMAGVDEEEAKERILSFKKQEKLQYLYQTQRSFIHSLVSLVNCKDDGSLKARNILDYWKKPEYIFLGPDENMHNEMIEWIADYSILCHYKPGGAFISSKPKAGINHKEYGVTSLGVNVCMHETLLSMGIDPEKDPFTVKISGGPDGDVAGNEMLNLYKYYPKTAKLLAITDVSGTIYDPEGLDLETIASFFHDAMPIRSYPPEKLSEGGFILDTFTKREQTAYAQQTLIWKKKGGKVVQDWLSGSEMNHLLRHNLHQVKTDVFVPAGGRPRTLNEHNWKDFLDKSGKPTSKAIIEGANLYLTPKARRHLEELGAIIIKDSSANKGGVICSSFEVLFGLTLSEEEFLKEKTQLMQETLEIIRTKARDEARLMLSFHKENKDYLTDISEWISERINTYTYQLLHHLEHESLSTDSNDPLIRCLLNHCPKLLKDKYRERIIHEIPDIHKKAIISSYIAAKTVYTKGLNWSPSIVDVLPVIAEDPTIIGPSN